MDSAGNSIGDELQQALRGFKDDPSTAGIFTDIDGTISEIAPTPDQAIVPEHVKQTLSLLAQRYAVVCAVSGRDAASASRMVGLENIIYIGNHGLEWIDHGKQGAIPEAGRFHANVPSLAAELKAIINDPSVLVEAKSFGVAVHYRLAGNQTRMQANLLEIIRPLTGKYGIKMLPGKSVIELRPDIDISKGDPVFTITRTHKLKRALFIGDDMTDIDGFRALKELEHHGEVQAVTIAVVSDESPAALAAEASYFVDGVSVVHDLLAWMAQ